ncbi:MAG: hypothetical protein HYS41_00045 [Candidatus Omnitrophica bacterium]|nr:hypothetical protein [Candidatus Omnitrophota bacterium]
MREKGLTLLEVLLATVLMGLVGVAFGNVLVTAQRYYIQTMNIASAQSEGAFAMEHMKRRLLPADRLILFNAQALAFRENNVWRGYRLNAASLEYAPDLGVAANDDPTLADLNGAAAEAPAVTGSIGTFTMRLPEAGRLEVEIVTEHAGGGDTRRMRLETVISPRGI